VSISLSCNQLVEITGAHAADCTKDIVFQGLEYDSRNVRGGELFVALRGDQSHGHEFVPQALDRGAALCLVEDIGAVQGVSSADRLIEVSDSLKAFWQIASWWRKKVALPLAGVTGSVGKTTVKELAASILLRYGRGTYARKSYNNHVGVPYTLCSINPDHKWAVLEMGMNHPGELADLALIAEPDVGLITLIAPVHQHAFDTLDEIADAKCEILRGMKESSPIIINADDSVLKAALIRNDPQSKMEVKSFGISEGSDIRVLNIVDAGMEGISFTLRIFDEDLDVHMGVLGKHNALNAAAAALVAKTLVPNLPLKHIKEGIERFISPQMRLRSYKTQKGRLVIDDSYNANPASMRALLEVAEGFQKEGGKIGFVLGDMLELGSQASKHHQEIAQAAADLKPAFLVAVGEFAPVFVETAKREGIRAFSADSPEAAAHIAIKMDFDFLLVKASRGIGLDRTVNTLLEVEGEHVPQPKVANPL
jgi:UDP-N-acetylmuramoyl-tripeptide--D-alanyl-D-alanine ligase